MIDPETDKVTVHHKIVVHRFSIYDTQDPDIAAGQPLWEWENSEVGRWCMQNSVTTPEWRKHTSHEKMAVEYAIIAQLTDQDLVYYKLKFT